MRGDRVAGRGVPGGSRRAGVALAVMVVASPAAGGGAAFAAGSPDPSQAPAGSPGPVRHIDLIETSMMQILDGDGQPVKVLAVKPGETLEIAVTNGARFPHNLYIGPEAALAADQTADLPGVPAFAGGTHAFTWTVPESVDGLWFGCTVVGHYSVMNGLVVAIADTMPDLASLPEADAMAALQASGLLEVERAEAADASVEPGTVIAQDPAPGAPVDLDTVVQLTVATAG